MKNNKVYFIKVNDGDSLEDRKVKLELLLQKSGVLDIVSSKDRVAVKLHFGEEGNKGYVSPCFLRSICDFIKKRQATSFLSDTNTLYRGRRINSAEHLKLAFEHGFTQDKTGVEVIIPDDAVSANVAELPIGLQYIKTARLAKIYLDADSLVGVAHFKGHIMTGFGGAIKNIGMGCASREGKLAQHCDVSPVVRKDACVGCGACLAVCPAAAISVEGKKAQIDNDKCIGCASCIAACMTGAIDVNWEAGGDVLQEKMVEYAYSLLEKKKGKCAFINFAMKITKECDCLAKDDPKISPDIGIFASIDPVAVDTAALDLTIKACGRNVFKEAHPGRDGFKQLEYASELGLGSQNYEMVEVR